MTGLKHPYTEEMLYQVNKVFTFKNSEKKFQVYMDKIMKTKKKFNLFDLWKFSMMFALPVFLLDVVFAEERDQSRPDFLLEFGENVRS